MHVNSLNIYYNTIRTCLIMGTEIYCEHEKIMHLKDDSQLKICKLYLQSLINGPRYIIFLVFASFFKI